ncbi:MAG: alpha-glucan family phosphorylase [Dehalococcoidia bacterium]
MRLRATRSFPVQPRLPDRIAALHEVADNLFWTWNTDARALFRRLGADRWEACHHNPIRMLQLTPAEQLERLAHDEGFVAHLDRVAESLRRYLSRPPWTAVPFTNKRSVLAYFSLEFALTESFPSYSGGLGVLAGDHLRSASDLGLPLVGVGIFYRQGYFQQLLGPDGWQGEEYTNIDPAHFPLCEATGPDGRPVRVRIPMDGREVAAAVWRIDVGHVPVLLLDTHVPENSPADREITARLYGGNAETRIQQEIVLGVGGVRALHALDYHAAVCHMNEGHSSFLGLERIRMIMEEKGLSFDEARIPVSAATVFTTHTAVAAGIDIFPAEMVRRYLGGYVHSFGLDDRTFLGLGRVNPEDEAEPFSMAILGLRLSGERNGVSQLHGAVSRGLWAGAWPALPVELVPIGAITNGVHLPSWVEHDLGELYDRTVGPQWRADPVSGTDWSHLRDVPDEEVWAIRERSRARLVVRARTQHREAAARKGSALHGLQGEPLDPRTLTIGFARRFAAYKRATLLFRDPARLARILNHPERPVQFIFAGKAHPNDEAGKRMIQEVVAHSKDPALRDRLVVLERYDVDLARTLVQGCDVWLNTPLRPLEASGTSGMKAVANGGLHMSVLDGWWAEAYRPGMGWAIGRDQLDDDPETQDAFDSASLYDLLEHEIAPLFYDRDADGIPRDWLRRVKASVVAFAPQFSTHRMVSDYVAHAYSPAARSWHHLLHGGENPPARDLNRWVHRVRQDWGNVHVLTVEDDHAEAASGRPVTIHVRGHWGGLADDDVRVDVVYGATSAVGEIERHQVVRMNRVGRDGDGTTSYAAAVSPAEGGRFGYAIRVLPDHPHVHNPLDLGLAVWA